MGLEIGRALVLVVPGLRISGQVAHFRPTPVRVIAWIEVVIAVFARLRK